MRISDWSSDVCSSDLRETELARLLDAQDALEPGAPRLCALLAPSGMGKTRLIDELIARLAQRGVSVHRGYCETYLGASALQPFHQIVRSILVRDHGVDLADGTGWADALERQIGRASGRERVCKYV